MLRTESDADCTPGAGLKEGRDAARRLVRELVCGGLSQFNAPSQGPLRLFALARFRPDAVADGAESRLPTGWVPKSGFGGGGGGMKLRRCSPVVVTMGGEVYLSCAAAVCCGDDMGGALWVQHTAVVKGLPHGREDGGL